MMNKVFITKEKIKKWLRRWISVILAFEALFHFAIPIISIVSMTLTNTPLNWATLMTPVTDIVFGIVCLIGSYFLDVDYQHHHREV